MLYSSLKRVSLLFACILLFFALIINSAVFANHNDTELGPAALTGHFSWPQGSIMSGDYTVYVEVAGQKDYIEQVTGVEFSITPEGEPNNILQTFSDTKSREVDYDNFSKVYELTFDTTDFKNGSYWIYAKIVTDDFVQIVAHHNGEGYYYFDIENPVVQVSPLTTPSIDELTLCENKLSAARSIAESIIGKHKSNINYIDNFSQETVLFYERHSLDLEDFDEISNQISISKKAVSDSIVLMESSGDFNCESSLKSQATLFLEQSARATSSLEKYKDSVINLILKVIEVI